MLNRNGRLRFCGTYCKLWIGVLSYCIKSKEFRTSKGNDLLMLNNSFSIVYENNSNKKTHQNVDGSFLVAGTGLEPVTFGL